MSPRGWGADTRAHQAEAWLPGGVGSDPILPYRGAPR